MKYYKHQGNLIKKIRKEHRLTQVELADIMDVHSQHISNCERAQCCIPNYAYRNFILFAKPKNFRMRLARALTLDHHAEIRDQLAEIYDNH